MILDPGTGRTPERALDSCAAIVIIVATAFIYNRWLLDSRTFFYADDWQWLNHAEFVPWSDQFFSILPSWAYNDRPVGAAFIKVLYQTFGLNHRAFQIALLTLHAFNCALLYAFAVGYIGRTGALFAALLAATWFGANEAVGWAAAIFDLLGATLSLLTIVVRKHSLQLGNKLPYDLVGAVSYAFAIRTKEFALGLILVLVLMNVLIERQSVRATFRQLWPYLLVFIVYAVRYAQLLLTNQPSIGSPYHLELSLIGLLTSLGYYFSAMFNGRGYVSPILVSVAIVALGIGMLRASERAQRASLWGIFAFVVLLAPVLLLPSQLYSLYLYAPHFFFSFALGALIAKRLVTIVLVAVVTAGVVIPPFWTNSRQDVIAYYHSKGQNNRALFASALEVLAPLAPGATVFISGVEPIFNPFWTKPGNSLNIAFNDFKIAIETEQPDADLVMKFCNTAEPKRFVRFEGTRATDSTGVVSKRCDELQRD